MLPRNQRYELWQVLEDKVWKTILNQKNELLKQGNSSMSRYFKHLTNKIVPYKPSHNF